MMRTSPSAQIENPPPEKPPTDIPYRVPEPGKPPSPPDAPVVEPPPLPPTGDVPAMPIPSPISL